MNEIAVTLNDFPVTGLPGMTILDLARQNGIDVPTLCYRPELSPLAACRLCVVEVAGSRTLVASCHTPLASNMVIHTHSPKVLKARKVIAELLLASHSGFCWSCDKANVCELRSIAAELGVGLPRFISRKRFYSLDGGYVLRDLTKCIQCRRCVRACREIRGEAVFSVAYRGFDSKVITGLDQPLDQDVCKDCDVCISFCPVGALTKGLERFRPTKGPPLAVLG